MNKTDMDRIEGRKWAEEIVGYVRQGPVEYQEGFWRQIRKEFPKEKEKKQIATMTEEQSRAFGKSIVGFGRYIGMRYDDVPLDYLEWLVDQNVGLTRYLESRRIQREREEAE